MKDLNNGSFVCRLTRDSELKYFSNGNAVLNFNVVVNTSRKNGDKWEDKANFFNLNLYGKTAENMSKMLVKGKRIAVNYHLEQNTWEKDGKKHYDTVIAVEQIQLLDGGNGGQNMNSEYSNPNDNATSDVGSFPEDIPFD